VTIDQRIAPVAAPSTRAILTATVIALLVAVVILVLFVLPAEYGIDPAGTGRALGLTDLARASQAPATPASAPETPAAAAAETAVIMPVLHASATGDAPTVTGTFIPQAGRFQMDSREIVLAPGEGMEIKYNMKKGAGLVYSWTTSVAVPFEFHGEPDVKPAGKEGTDYYESYELDDKAGKSERHGTFVAPSTGIHGWFWENKTSGKVTLKLVAAGYFDWVSQNRHDKHTALKPMDVYALPSHPAIPDQVMQ
jgi:hypothetical protein